MVVDLALVRSSARNSEEQGQGLRLIRADSDRFTDLEAQWGAQAEAFGENFGDYARPFIDHARGIADGKLGTDRYGIYLLEGERGFEGLAHLNVARLPHTTGRTLRVLWILLAPRYDYGDADPEILAKIAFAFIWEPLRLASEANNPLTAEHIKIHLGNHADRAFFAGVVSTLRGAPLVTAVAVRGNWLHLSLA